MSATMTTTAPPPRLRPATFADRAAIERLLTANALPLDGVADALPGFLVAEADGRLVGVAGLEPCGDHALLRSVAVEAAWRAHGVGRALVARAIVDAEASGTRALYVLTTTAEHYFPRFGFQPIPRDDAPPDIRATGEFREACPATVVVMRLSVRES